VTKTARRALWGQDRMAQIESLWDYCRVGANKKGYEKFTAFELLIKMVFPGLRPAFSQQS
jgi:hypothetical protein